MEGSDETESGPSLKLILVKLNNTQKRMEDNFTNLLSQIDSKQSHQEMLDNQKAEFERLQSDLKNVRDENSKLQPALKQLPGKLTVPENYTSKKENLQCKISKHSRRRGRKVHRYSGRQIAPNTGAKATKFFTLATKS